MTSNFPPKAQNSHTIATQSLSRNSLQLPITHILFFIVMKIIIFGIRITPGHRHQRKPPQFRIKMECCVEISNVHSSRSFYKYDNLIRTFVEGGFGRKGVFIDTLGLTRRRNEIRTCVLKGFMIEVRDERIAGHY